MMLKAFPTEESRCHEAELLLFLSCFLGLHPWQIPRLGVELELQPPACTTATAPQEWSHACDLHHSSWQHWILNPLSRDRDRTHILMDTSWVRFHCATVRTP